MEPACTKPKGGFTRHGNRKFETHQVGGHLVTVGVFSVIICSKDFESQNVEKSLLEETDIDRVLV